MSRYGVVFLVQSRMIKIWPPFLSLYSFKCRICLICKELYFHLCFICRKGKCLQLPCWSCYCHCICEAALPFIKKGHFFNLSEGLQCNRKSESRGENSWRDMKKRRERSHVKARDVRVISGSLVQTTDYTGTELGCAPLILFLQMYNKVGRNMFLYTITLKTFIRYLFLSKHSILLTSSLLSEFANPNFFQFFHFK